jgi:membrane-associated phospholipid phosphatase
MLSAVTYLTIGTLLARIEERRTLRVYFVSVAIFLTLSVGISRIYLGVHWPTDVLAGWIVGSAWALFAGEWPSGFSNGTKSKVPGSHDHEQNQC